MSFAAGPRQRAICFAVLWIYMCVTIGVLATYSAQTAAAATADEIVLVAEGRLTDQWETKGNWIVGRDGAVRLQPRAGESGWKRFDAYLWSTETYDNFEIEFDYMVETAGNSGFYFHVGDKSEPVKTGIEVQLFDSFSRNNGTKLNDHDSGGVIPGIAPTKDAARPPHEWNRVEVTVVKGTLKVVLNGELVNSIRLDHPKIKDRPARGFIGFQDHGMPLAIRNVRLQSLQSDE